MASQSSSFDVLPSCERQLVGLTNDAGMPKLVSS
jgi:hypothetical protein